MEKTIKKVAISALAFIVLYVFFLSGPSYVVADEQLGQTPSMSGAKGPGSPASEAGSGSAGAVAFTGTATYSIPIVTPPGRLGVAPNVSLNYSSQGGNGWMGVGWDFDLGSIQRSVKNGVTIQKMILSS